MSRYSLGLDYGTNSVRALLVNIDTGEEAGTSVYQYRAGDHGVLYAQNEPNLARQDPQDYADGLEATVRDVMTRSGVAPSDVVGIGVDTTGSTPTPVNAAGIPLAILPEFKTELAAYAWLWKDHTAYAEAAEITEKASGYPYLAKCGNTYSSEWFWSKILKCARVAPEVFAAAHSWVELADYVPALLTGNLASPVRGICAAGHKAMYSDDWGGLPSPEFLATLDPRLAELRSRLYSVAIASDQPAGNLTQEWATRLGLATGTPVAVGAFDAHFGAVGSGVQPGTLVKIIGTSTCDCLVHPLDAPLADIPGLCGIVKGSVLPGFYGLEAGQSAVGDLFAWVVRLTGRSHAELTAEAEASRPGTSGLIALDWNNGNRTILVDPMLTGLLIGQTLHTTPGEVYRAVIEATAFGALKIVRRLEEYGVEIQEVMNCGGIAERSALTMQIYADVMNRPMRVSSSSQTCALGSAIFGAVVGGGHPDVASAQAAMVPASVTVYHPNPDAVAVYAELYEFYSVLHDGFGGGAKGAASRESLATLMPRLIALRDRALAQR